jgi:hypothetical protein
MAVAGISINLQVQELREIQQALGRIFEPSDRGPILKAAIEKAIVPLVSRLKQTTPVGPTGNLRDAISSKVIVYPISGNAVGLVGFRRAGQNKSESARGGRVRRSVKKGDRGFHQYWLEEGTAERQISSPVQPKAYSRRSFPRGPYVRREFQMARKGKTFAVQSHLISQHVVRAHEVANFSGQAYYYASSYAELGKFRINKVLGDPKRFTTDPAYPNAFFKRSKDPIALRPMPAGGSSGQPPLKTAWDQTRSTVAEILSRELRISLSRALETLTRSSLGTLESRAP